MRNIWCYLKKQIRGGLGLRPRTKHLQFRSALLSETASVLCLLCLFVCSLLVGCMAEMAAPEPEAPPVYRDVPSASVVVSPVSVGPSQRELSAYDAVDLTAFVGLIPEKPFTASQEKRLREQYLKQWFSPWTDSILPPKSDLRIGLSYLTKGTFYRENKRLADPAFLKKMTAQVNLETFPNAKSGGVAVRYTHLRYLPDYGGLFETPDDFPFDVLQVTSIGPGTPLRLWHMSRDGLWVYVVAPFASGWVPVMDVATMGTKSIAWAMSRPLGSIVRDDVALLDKNTRRAMVSVAIGQHFPSVPQQPAQVYVPVRQAGGQAKWVRAVAPEGTLRPFGAGWSQAQMAGIASQVLGELYGWGGMFFHRDCSAMIRDMLAPFGLWLPRNSSAQAKQGGRFVSLAGLDIAEKKRRIVAQGRPFLTLLWLKGHIMVYVGSPYGEPMALHNIWAVRVRDPHGHVQKVVIGRAVVTDLAPGNALPDFDSSQSLLTRIEGMTFLGEQ